MFSYGVVLCELLSRQMPAFKVFGRQPPDFAVDPEEIRYGHRKRSWSLKVARRAGRPILPGASGMPALALACTPNCMLLCATIAAGGPRHIMH